MLASRAQSPEPERVDFGTMAAPAVFFPYRLTLPVAERLDRLPQPRADYYASEEGTPRRTLGENGVPVVSDHVVRIRLW